MFGDRATQKLMISGKKRINNKMFVCLLVCYLGNLLQVIISFMRGVGCWILSFGSLNSCNKRREKTKSNVKVENLLPHTIMEQTCGHTTES